MFTKGYNLIRILLGIIVIDLFIVHIAVPIIMSINGWTWVYSRSFDLGVVIALLLMIILAIVPYIYFSKKYLWLHTGLPLRKYCNVYSVILIFYTVVYILSGGLTYRFEEVDGSARSAFTNIILTLVPVMLVLCVYMALSKKMIPLIASLLFITTLILSGGRGYLVQFFMMMFLFIRLRDIQNGMNLSIIKYRDFFVFGLLISFFGLTGILRDGGDNVIFTTILRLSEPYWYLAYENAASEFNQFIFEDILQRLVWAITRVNLFNVSGNIDGNVFYLPKILNIELLDGVSLPITLIGQGYLLSGSYGVVGLLILGVFIAIFGLRFILRWKVLDSNILNIYVVYYISKMFNFHAKSITGLTSYLIYESIRDLLLLTIIHLVVNHLFWRNVSK